MYTHTENQSVVGSSAETLFQKDQQDIGGEEFGGKQAGGRCRSSLSFLKMAGIIFLHQHESPEMKSGKHI